VLVNKEHVDSVHAVTLLIQTRSLIQTRGSSLMF